jgi:CRISPR-associated endonuclease Csn1
MQLVLSYEKECYVRNVVKLLSKPENVPISKFDHVSKEENLELYDLITQKLCDTILNVKFALIGEKLSSGRETFVNLNEREQCFVLNEVLKIVHCNAVLGDLKLIKDVAHAGATTIPSKLTSINGASKIYLVNQSITGLFETKTDLMNM